MKFVDRQNELARLDRFAAADEGGLVVVYGRYAEQHNAELHNDQGMEVCTPVAIGKHKELSYGKLFA